MNYIQGTIGLPLILSIEKYRNIKWYVDAYFVVYNDMSHTGGFMTIETGVAWVQYNKQKFNTKISAEAILVGMDDVLVQVVCTKYFLKYKVYEIHDNVIYQDTQRDVKLEKNGRRSSSRLTRYINIRYYEKQSEGIRGILFHLGNYRRLFHKGTTEISMPSLFSYHYWYPWIWHPLL